MNWEVIAGVALVLAGWGIVLPVGMAGIIRSMESSRPIVYALLWAWTIIAVTGFTILGVGIGTSWE